jgi:hypothetical protein
VQKDKRNQCQAELIRASIVPRATNFPKKISKTLGPPLFLLLQQILPKKHKGAIMAPHLLLKKNIRPTPLPPPAIKFAKKLQGGPSLSQPHFGLSVRMKLTLPKVGTLSPSGLPKI